MRRRTVYLGLIIVLSIIVSIAVGFIIFYPERRIKPVVSTQIQETYVALQHIQEAERQLGRLGPPDSTPLQQYGRVKPFVDEFIKSTEIVKPFSSYTLNKPQNIWSTGISYQHNKIQSANKLINDDSSQLAYSRTGALLAQSYALINHQGLVLKLFTNLLEYNPSQDFANFDLKTPDTQKRLKNAQTGLTSIEKELANFNSDYPDKTLGDLKQIIANLQVSRNQLAAGGELQNWISAVNRAQLQIVSNRQSFWKTDSHFLALHLLGNEVRLAELNRSWQQLKY